MKFETFIGPNSERWNISLEEQLVEFYTAAKKGNLVNVHLPTLRADIRKSKLLQNRNVQEWIDDLCCITCLAICLPPVYGCMNGHPICNTCDLLLDGETAAAGATPVCPACKDDEYPTLMLNLHQVQFLLDRAPKPDTSDVMIIEREGDSWD